MLRVAVYTGVFDPVHFGHLHIIERGTKLFDRVIVAVGDNPEKTAIFTQAERVQLLQDVVKAWPSVEVRSFSGLAVQYVRAIGARIMLRGLRTTSDMEYEFTMSLTNLSLDPGIETVFLMARESFSHISGTLLRQIARYGGDLDKFVPAVVKDALSRRLLEDRRKNGNG